MNELLSLEFRGETFHGIEKPVVLAFRNYELIEFDTIEDAKAQVQDEKLRRNPLAHWPTYFERRNGEWVEMN